MTGEDLHDVCGFDLLLDDAVCLNFAREESDDDLQFSSKHGSGAYRCIVGLSQSVDLSLSDGLCFPRACRMCCDLSGCDRLHCLLEPSIRIVDLYMPSQVAGGPELSGPFHELGVVSKCWHDCDDFSFHEGLIAPYPMGVKMFLSTVGTFLNHASETSHAFECQK